MATYTIQPQDNSAYCHFLLASEKEYGLQSLMFKDGTRAKEYAGSLHNIVKSVCENRPCKDVCFLHVAIPGKAFESFDKEKHKLVLLAKPYFKLLEFFANEWQPLVTRMEADHANIKARKDWIKLTSFLSFQGDANIIYKLPLDTLPNSVTLDLVCIKKGDSGKTSITLSYSDESLGSISLPLPSMMHCSQQGNYVSGLYNYKEPVLSKRSRQL